MITDIKTILWKEVRELFQARQGMFGRGGWISIAVIVGLLGILLPVQAGEAWVKNPIHMIWWVWVPFLLVTYIVTDTFAGERERHTLETLLASRLSDKTILFGKVASVVLYGWGIAILGIAVGLITVNVTAGKGRLLLYSTEATVAILSLSFLFSLLSSITGVLISLRSSTVRQAQQITGLISLVPILPIVLLDILPNELIQNWMAGLSRMNGSLVVSIAVGILAVINLAFIALAMSQFRRAKLILD
jgi:ABC-2 type transport system permease protein